MFFLGIVCGVGLTFLGYFVWMGYNTNWFQGGAAGFYEDDI